MEDRRNIHTIGDSHCNRGWRHIKGVRRHHLGAILCYSVGAKNKIRDLHHYGVVDGDVVVFCFGEIDCRCHVHKHVSNERSHEIVIDEIVASYMRAIRRKCKYFSCLTICVYNVPPAVHKAITLEYPEYPFLGTDEERRTYVEYFNACLRQRCPEFGFVFFDIYDQCVDDEGFLHRNVSDGVVHIDDGNIIGGFLDRVLCSQDT